MVYVFQNFLVDIIAFKIFDVWKVTLIINTLLTGYHYIFRGNRKYCFDRKCKMV